MSIERDFAKILGEIVSCTNVINNDLAELYIGLSHKVDSIHAFTLLRQMSVELYHHISLIEGILLLLSLKEYSVVLKEKCYEAIGFSGSILKIIKGYVDSTNIISRDELSEIASELQRLHKELSEEIYEGRVLILIKHAFRTGVFNRKHYGIVINVLEKIIRDHRDNQAILMNLIK
ncbi:MAG: hypothetical protein N3E36_01820 [Sulfolobales archaeon]|nr:hypothetical protein [Sulfolobales archaeon]MCX8198752.1 hypothetical protein [Sulfolobales archaeon]MDW8169825.1 hypothetical protein [Desulfurococcaceae archaeon]